jgi:opacity protein-like surface antigen
MKKLVLALTAVAAFTGSALAADLPARTYTKAPVMPEAVYNWTGFYIFGGAGGGLWEADTTTVNPTSEPSVPATTGSSTALGSRAFSLTASSATSKAPSRIRDRSSRATRS